MARTPDIALFTRWVWGGGAERVISNLAYGLAERGFQVDLIIMQDRGESATRLHPNLRLINFDVQTVSKQHRLLPTGFQSVNSLIKLVKYLKQHRPTVLLSATHFVNETALLARSLARVPTRVIVTEHTFLSKEAKLTEQVSARLIPWTVRALYALADEVIAVSHGVAQDLATFLGHRHKPIKVIYNSVVTPEIYQLAQHPIEHPWFTQKDYPIILAGGRFVCQKDFPTLLRAFAKVRQTLPARLVLLGEGRDRASLEQLAESLGIATAVWLPGFVDNPYAYLKQADVFALSSAWEGLPTILIEAIAIGTPVVSTECPSGPSEILQQGEYGQLVPVGDVDALAAALVTTLQGNYQLAPDHWIQEFTPEAVIRQYVNVLGLKPPIPSLETTALVTKPESSKPKPKLLPTLLTAKGKTHVAIESPLVSIVIPAYNAADLIDEALASVQQQTYPHWQVLIVEDGTQDGTESIAQTFAQSVGSAKVQYIRHEVNQGLSAARNTGIAHASGKYVALLDHDDTWQPQHLEKLVEVLETSGADLAYAPAEFFDYHTRKPLGFHGPQDPELAAFPSSLFNRNFIPASAVVMKRQVHQQVGGFDTQLKRVEDLDYWLRCAEAGITFEYVPEITNGYRQRNPNAMTACKEDILEWHARVLRKHYQLTAVSKVLRDRVLARYHLGVVRRNLKTKPFKAWEFLYWSIRIAPFGSLAAMHWVCLEALGWTKRYV